MTELTQAHFNELTERSRTLGEIERKLLQMKGRSFLIGSYDKHRFPVELDGGIVSFLMPHKSARVLDLGAGFGVFSAELATNMTDRGCEIGVDAIDKHVPDGHRNHPQLSWSEADADDITSLGASRYNLIVCSYVLHYLKDPIMALNKMVKATRPGGFIIFNGADSLKKVIGTEPGDYISLICDLVYDPGKIQVYGGGSTSDWVILKVIDPNCAFNFILDSHKTIRADATFNPFTGKAGISSPRFFYIPRNLTEII